jgi:hypothetical protein
VNFTEIEQFAPAATDVPQVLVCAKSPDVAIELRASAACPELANVTVCAALVVPVVCDAKVRLVGEGVAVGVAATPVPLSATVCGEPMILSEIVTVPVRLPTAVGLKVTEIVQPAPAAMLAPQVLVSEKSPEAPIKLKFKAAEPGLLIATVCAALAVPSVCDAKVRVVGESRMPGPEAFPLSATRCGLPGPLSAILRVPVRLPPSVGVKVTSMAQAVPTLIPPLQLLVSEKSPEMLTFETFNPMLPVLLNSSV